MAWGSRPFTLPRLLLCEGPEDCVFFQNLIDVRGINRFHVADTSGTDHKAGGNTGFERALDAAAINRNFQSVRHIVVVSDNDDDPAARFNLVCDQVVAAGYPRPATPEQTTVTGRPRITVVMIPAPDQHGDLEGLCVAAADSANAQVAQHVATFKALLHTERWPVPRAGKLHLRASLAARHRDPFVPLGKALRDAPDLIPLTHPSFDRLAELLGRLA